MRLEIILRVHDGGNVHEAPRALEVSKAEIVKRCARSLATAMRVEGIKAFDALTIIVDEIQDDTHNSLVDSLSGGGWRQSKPGNSASLAKAIDQAAHSEADAVLLLEDDYLWQPDGVGALIEAWETFSAELDKPIALHPCDDYWNYVRHDPCRIVAAESRAWRTNQHCTGTMMIAPETIRNFRLTFDRLALTEREEGSINRLWGGPIQLFSPLVPCAWHLNENRHPFHDYTSLWEGNAC